MEKLFEFIKRNIPEGETNLRGDNLRNVLDELLKFEEFKNVKKVNVVDYPIYIAKKGSQKPIKTENDYFGGETDTVNTYCRKILDDMVNPFNEEIDIFSLELTLPMIDAAEIEKIRKSYGVWRIPTIYDPLTFNPINSIIVNWSPEVPENIGISEKDFRENLINKFIEMLDGKPNIPMKRGIIIRCSPRSFEKKID